MTIIKYEFPHLVEANIKRAEMQAKLIPHIAEAMRNGLAVPEGHTLVMVGEDQYDMDDHAHPGEWVLIKGTIHPETTITLHVRREGRLSNGDYIEMDKVLSVSDTQWGALWEGYWQWEHLKKIMKEVG